MAEEKVGREPSEPVQSAEDKTSSIRYEPWPEGRFSAREVRGGRIVLEGVEGQLVDVAGRPIEGHGEWHGAVGRTTAEGFVNLPISQGEFERLSSKTREVLAEAALVQERIAKDQEEIELFKMETREVLKRLRAA